MKVTQGGDNVFEDIGFDREEAASLKVRADLMLDLRKYIEMKGWTQSQAATFFGESQPRISNLMQGDIRRFSVDKLINMLTSKFTSNHKQPNEGESMDVLAKKLDARMEAQYSREVRDCPRSISQTMMSWISCNRVP